jgi:hypothetical protein
MQRISAIHFKDPVGFPAAAQAGLRRGLDKRFLVGVSPHDFPPGDLSGSSHGKLLPHIQYAAVGA